MYWNSLNSNTLTVSNVGGYISYPHMASTIPEGYNCDPLQPATALFLGSCDLDGPIKDTNKSWARQVYADLRLRGMTPPYIALAKMTAGFMSFPRRLLTFCEHHGPPKLVYAVIPRPVAIEVPISTGEIVSLSDKEMFINWLKRHEKISQEDYDLLLATSKYCQAQINNQAYQLYQFEQSAAFIEMICKNNGIDFRWTVNLSASAIEYYAIHFDTFMRNCDWMKKTFIGVPKAIDFGFDGSMGEESQNSVHAVFSSPSRYDPLEISMKLDENLALVKARK